MTQRKKLIEVALPLEAINAAAAREKSIRHGHPSTLHLWWARRPLAACRAVLFAQLVDDPSSHPDRFPTEAEQEQERERLFEIIRKLVKWENSNNPDVLDEARREILKATDGQPPPVLDPFCGGGSIPLEAQRLGLEAHASDLNPVAVLITKALIEIPPRFANRPPVHPITDKKLLEYEWRGAQGLAADVRYYGQWMRDEAERRIGHLYPPVTVVQEPDGRFRHATEAETKNPKRKTQNLTVIAWLWARTVRCPNPACGARMPLVRSFALSTKKGKAAWVKPVIDHKAKTVTFDVKTGDGKPPEGTVNRRGTRCLVCDESVTLDHVRIEAKAGRMSAQMMAIVAEAQRGRIYLPPLVEHEVRAVQAQPANVPDTDLPKQALGFRVQGYGMTKHRDLFTPRQLVALTTFSDLVGEVNERVLADARQAGLADDVNSIDQIGTGAVAYANAISIYLAFAIDKMADTNSVLCTWQIDPPRLRATFGRQALPMTWDYAEANIFGDAAGDYQRCFGSLCEVLDRLDSDVTGFSIQRDATSTILSNKPAVFSTDPPYYDNIGYADLSDYFYVWLRRSLYKVLPNHFSTLLVPKNEELVATPFRFDGSKDRAKRFFEDRLGKAFFQIHSAQEKTYPLSIYYAFKQTEESEDGNEDKSESADSSTGWETMLEGLIKSGFSITGTWPMRSEMTTRNVGRGTNALASSIVLVCRPRSAEAAPATRREFLNTLKRELPDALTKLQHGNVAPVDLAQASIGPGMAIFSRYGRVLEADGRAMTVRTALQIINQELDAHLAAQEGEMDRETRFCLAWFEQYGMSEGAFGEADVLARAKNTAVQALVDAGVLHSRAGKVRLRRRDEYPDNWNPALDRRLTVWECTQHLIRQLNTGGLTAAGRLSNLLSGHSEAARALAYRLYAICERKKWADEALAYNTLVVEWPAIGEQAAQAQVMPTEQTTLPLRAN